MSLPPGEIHVWFHGVDLAPAAVDALARTLTSAELARAARFHFDADRRRSIVARASLRQHLSGYSGLDPASILIRTEHNTKPDAPATGMHFNVSHAGDLVGLAFCVSSEVGFDVERVRPMRDAVAIASRYFSPDEQQMLAGADDLDDVFFRIWTAKEAIVKGTGKGLSSDLSAFTVPLGTTTLTPLYTTVDEYAAWSVAAVPAPRDGYRAAVAARNANLAILVQDATGL